MFSAYLRNAVNLAFAVLLAAILGFLIQFFLPYMGPQDGLFYQSFTALEQWALFLMIAAVLASILVRAVVESQIVGGVR